MTVGANEIEDVVFATVTWRYKVVFGIPGGVDAPTESVVWAELGGKELMFTGVGSTRDFDDFSHSTLGFSDPGAFVDPTLTFELSYHPTAAEKATGFTFDVFLGAWRAQGSNELGFSIDVESATVFGK